MGNCGDKPLPNTRNICSSRVGELHTLPNFCTLLGSIGDSYGDDWCPRLGSPGEWDYDGNNAGSCSYNSCGPYQDFGFGCCDGCCGIIGKKVGCRRRAFNGDTLKCCLQNFECGERNEDCFSDEEQRNTCSPESRTVRSGECRHSLAEYCSGANTTGNEWLDRWTTGPCLTIFRKNLYSTTDRPCYTGPDVPISPNDPCPSVTRTEPINSQGFIWGRDVIESVLIRYTNSGFVLGSLPGQTTYHPFQDVIFKQVCCAYPEICQTALKKQCSNYTSQRLTLNPGIANWCGCQLPPGENQRYTDRYQINPACTPTCNRLGVIPLAGTDGPVRCDQNICLIDDITIDLSRTQAGGISINQLCGNCQKGGSCSCIIENNSIIAANSSIGGGIQLNQDCKAATCTRTNPTDQKDSSTITVNCDAAADYNPWEERQREIEQARTRQIVRNLLIIGAIIVAVVIIIAILYWILKPKLT